MAGQLTNDTVTLKHRQQRCTYQPPHLPALVHARPHAVANIHCLRRLVRPQLNADSITYNDAANDCCCHIAKTQKTIPLDRIQVSSRLGFVLCYLTVWFQSDACVSRAVTCVSRLPKQRHMRPDAVLSAHK